MRNMLAFLAALVLTFIGLGAWRDWYTVGTLPAEGTRVAFRVEIDGGKVFSDLVQSAKAVSRKISEQSKDKDKDGKASEKPAGE
jgi:hypothetical protein